MSTLASSEGVELSLLAFDGGWLVFEASRAWAPGSPVAVRAELGGATHPLTARSIGSRRVAEGRFQTKLRMVSLSRQARKALLAELPPTPPPRA